MLFIFSGFWKCLLFDIPIQFVIHLGVFPLRLVVMVVGGLLSWSLEVACGLYCVFDD